MELYLLGFGKTTKAIQKHFPNSRIYDDKFFGNGIFSTYQFPTKLFQNNFLVPTPAIPPHHQIIQRFQQNILSEYDLFFHYKKFPFSIWISGTNGKTTTTQMCKFILGDEYILGGNIGIPLGELEPDKKWILETSSFSLHYTNSAKPNIYLLLPITQDHISWHGNFDNYVASKIKPIFQMNQSEYAIIPEQKEILTKINKKEIKTNIIYYKNAEDLASKFDIDIEKIEFKSAFLLDAVLALVAQKILGEKIDYQKINEFQPDEHRQEKIIDKKSRIWINDSKATNPDSTIQFIKTIKNRELLLILGGQDKGADWNNLFQELQKIDVKLFLIGSSIKKAIKCAKKYGIKFKISETLKQAVKDIELEYSANSIAGLSPASASFDQFKSYEERGKVFKLLISSIN